MQFRYGFVPNGGRIYYLQRSQPPLLSGMVYEYYESTQDTEFVKELLPTLEKEFSFWHTQRSLYFYESSKIFPKIPLRQ